MTEISTEKKSFFYFYFACFVLCLVAYVAHVFDFSIVECPFGLQLSVYLSNKVYS